MKLLSVFILSAPFGVAALAGPKAPKQPPVVCKLASVMDKSTQIPAFTYLVPKDWSATDEFSWIKPGLYNAMISETSSDHECEVAQFERQLYQYSIRNNVNGGPPSVDKAPVHHATDFLHAILDQMVKAPGIDGVEVIDEINQPIPTEKVPLWSRNGRRDAMGTYVPCNETGFLQIKFMHNGSPVIAQIGTTVTGMISTKILPGSNFVSSESGTYMVGPTTFLVRPESVPAKRQREMQVIAGSIQMTPQFDAYFRKLTTRMAKIQIGANIAATQYGNETFHERSMAQFSQQMHLKDAYSHAFCNYVSDLQDFKDSKGRIVTASTAYPYAWDDGNGNYLFNDDPTVDLRGYGSGRWERMAKARIGE